MKGINTLEQLAEIKRIPIEVAKDAVVLNADDPHCLAMADYSNAERICYVTMNPSHSLVKEHIQAGGQAFVLEAGMNGHMITIYDQEAHIPLLWSHLVPATAEGRAMHNVQNAMFAAALAYNLNIKLDGIRQGLRTFGTTFYEAPGRMNMYDEHEFKVILDYAHNAAAVKAICDLVAQFDVAGDASSCWLPRATAAMKTSPRSRASRPRCSTTSSAGATTTRAGAARMKCRRC
jgi:cyanophycin synthetase